MKAQKSSHITKVDRKWHLIDVSSAPVGRIATKVATLLRGKHKRTFTPNVDCGDFVVVINGAKLQFTGRKIEQKLYYRHSGYLGGIKQKSLKDEIVRNPEFVFRTAVRSMLDEVKFRKAMMARLKFVLDDKHSYPVTDK
jgi:large subunit ribosomal protein L13